MAQKTVRLVVEIDAESGDFTRVLKGAEGDLGAFRNVIQGVFQGVGQAIFRLALKPVELFVDGVRRAISLVGEQFKAGFRDAMALETALAEVSTLGVRDIERLRSGVLRLSSSIGEDAVRSTKALYQAISAGIPEENVLSFLEVSSKAAIAGLTDTETAVDALSSVVNAYGFEAEKAADVSDKFFAAIKLGKTTFPELAGAIGRVAPIAAQFGVSIDEVLAALARMTQQGINTDEAVTGLRAAINALIRPTGEAEAILNEMSGGAWDLRRAIAEKGGLFDALADLGIEYLPNVFNEIRGLNAMMALVGTDGGAALNQVLREIQNSTGAAETAFEQMANTTETQWNRTVETFRNIRKEMVGPVEEASGSVLKILNDTFGPSLTETASLFAASIENILYGIPEGEDTNLIGKFQLWAIEVNQRMWDDLTKVHKGEMTLSEMLKGWIDDSKPKMKELWTKFAESEVGQRIIDGLKAMTQKFIDTISAIFIEVGKAVGAAFWNAFNQKVDEMLFSHPGMFQWLTDWIWGAGGTVGLGPGTMGGRYRYQLSGSYFQMGGQVPGGWGGGDKVSVMAEPGEWVLRDEQVRELVKAGQGPRVVQVVLDGRVLAEAAVRYGREESRRW